MEDPELAVQRALSEELGVEEYEKVYHIGDSEEAFTSGTFPGIESTYKLHNFVAVLPGTSFAAGGYVEYQTDKTNYYTWELVHGN